MRNIFENKELEAQFQKDGFVKVPFISTEEVAYLKQMFFDTLPESGGQITSSEIDINDEHLISYDFTFIDKNADYKRKVFKIISDYFKPHMEGLLANYRPIIANYIRKKPHSGEVPLHQNWAFADERKCTTISIWCPLVDSTVANGTLQLVPGSHKRFGESRGPMVPWELEGMKNEIIEKYLIPVETKAGDCIILDDSILHYSPENSTNELRLAIQLICVPNEFPSIHYYMDPSISKSEISVLEVSDDFYMEFNPWKKPEGQKVIKKIPFKYQPIDEEMYLKKMKQPPFDKPRKGLLNRLKSVLKSND
jgi:ectoine hydroxylase-related dioxygenase (phytanoyl-CoA dioxygenase family)